MHNTMSPYLANPALRRVLEGAVRDIRRDDAARRDAGRMARGRVAGHYSEEAGAFVGMKGVSWGMAGDSMAWAFTKADVASVKRDMRKIGVRASDDEAFGLLCEAAFALENPEAYNQGTVTPVIRKYQDRAEYVREKRRRRIAKLREAGICIICAKEYVDPTRSTCHPCGVKANEWNRSRKSS